MPNNPEPLDPGLKRVKLTAAARTATATTVDTQKIELKVLFFGLGAGGIKATTPVL